MSHIRPTKFRKLKSSHISRNLAWTGGQRMLSGVLYVVIAGLAARVMDTRAFGTYFLAITTIAVVALVVGLGFSQISVRDVARALAENDQATARKAAGSSLSLVCSATLVCGIATFGVTRIDRADDWARSAGIVSISGCVLLLLATVLQTQVSQLLRSMQLFRAAEAVASTAGYLILVIYLGVCAAFDVRVDAGQLIWATVGAYVVPVVVGLVIIAGRLGGIRMLLRDFDVRGFRLGQAKASVLVTSHNVSLFVVRQGALWVAAGALGTYSVGLFAAASRISLLLAFPLSIVNSVVGPYVAADFGKADGNVALNRRLAVSSFAAGLVALAVSAALCVDPTFVLSTTYGPKFSAAADLLVILIIGQLANVLAGSCGIVLLMTGHYKILAMTSVSTATLTLAASFVGGHLYGAVGIACAFTAGLCIQNAAMLYLTWSKTRLQTQFRPFETVRILRGMAST